MDAISESRLAAVYPGLADRVRQMETILEGEHEVVRVVEGLRTVGEQNAAWQKGRNPDGSYIDPVHHTGVVTNARGGYSWHQFGLAVDCAPSTHGPGETYDPDWNPTHPTWRRMEQVGVSVGLTSGAYWLRLVDAPHFQMTGRFPEDAPTNEVRQLYAAGGLQAVWDAAFNDGAPDLGGAIGGADG